MPDLKVTRRFRLIFLSGLLAVASAPVLGQGSNYYEEEYPGINYSTAPTSDPISRLLAAIDRGEIVLEYKEERGYLDSLLQALDIDPSSQLLVFSKTSLKSRFVTPETPRALYFNDDIYVGFTQGSRSLEIASMDPNLGPVFYGLFQDPAAEKLLEREINRCLRCHDSYSMTGGGVPRFLLSSGLVGENGDIVSHEINLVTDTSTPFSRRWGGWYVAGTHGDLKHMGNLIIKNLNVPVDLDMTERGNKTDLGEYFNVETYPSKYSDIVALLVVQHQVEVQNLIVRVNYETRTALYKDGMIEEQRLAEVAEPLVEGMLMVNEAAISSPITGISGYAEYFQALGPKDSKGRSLRELDLVTRTFKYPLSYLIYSAAFSALPGQVKTYIYQRLNDILRGRDQTETFAFLSASERLVILEILQETWPEFTDSL